MNPRLLNISQLSELFDLNRNKVADYLRDMPYQFKEGTARYYFAPIAIPWILSKQGHTVDWSEPIMNCIADGYLTINHTPKEN